MFPLAIVAFLGAMIMTIAMRKLPHDVVGYEDGKPFDLKVLPIGDGFYMEESAAKAFCAMSEIAAQHGIVLKVNSAFRTFAEQERLYFRYLNKQTPYVAAKPGYSNHQKGYSVDISVGGTKESDTYKFLDEVAAAVGFINAVSSEPHHWTFVPDSVPAVG